MQQALLWIVLFPLVGAVLNGLFGRFVERRVVSAIGVGSVALAFAVALAAFVQIASGEVPGRLVHDVYEWFSFPLNGREVSVHIRFVMDVLSGVMALVVTGIGLLIHVYSTGYMHEDPSYARFFAYLNLFMASMLTLVLASSLPLMFVGWEGVGLCSYLLIGFWFENRDYAKAGRKAFVMNRIGDFGVLAGMFVLLASVGSFEFEDISRAAPALGGMPFAFGSLQLGTVATAACLFLFLGATGKSAQIPLYTWLPDAMAGPTPVSALIHAATMVTAGVYLCVRLSALFLASPTALAVVAVVGASTALLAASVALVQNDMKKILAFSTVSQLGFMFAAVGSGAFRAGMFHVFTHAFFKACLFLGAGSVMHAVGAHGDADIRKLGGLRRFMPRTHLTFLLATMAIAGVPLTAGFFSKDLILMGAAAASELGVHGEGGRWVGWFVYGVLVLAAVMTAFYMFRLYFLTFTGSYRSAEGAESAPEGSEGHEHAYAAHPHESPVSMTVPLLVLGVGSILAGWLDTEALAPALHFRWWDEWMGVLVHAPEGEAHAAHTAAGIGGFAAMVVGIGLAFALYKDKAPDAFTARLPAGLHALLLDKWRVDELYEGLVVRPLARLATVSAWVDKTFVDGLLAGASSALVRLTGWLVARAHVGRVHAYGAMMVLGVFLVAIWFLYPQVDLRGQVEGSVVHWSLEPGLGYRIRWDRDADGRWDTDWSSERFELSASLPTSEVGEGHGEEGAARGLVLLVEGLFQGEEPRELPLSSERWVPIPRAWLGPPPLWADEEASDASPPLARIGEDGAVRLRAAGAVLRRGGERLQEVSLAPGEQVVLGGLGAGPRLRVGRRVAVRVQVESAFGYRREGEAEVVLVPPRAARAEAALQARDEVMR